MWVLGVIAGFFLFSLVVQALFNSVVVGALGLYQPLSYLQAAGLWLLITLLFGWIPFIGVWARRLGAWRLSRLLRERLRRWLEASEEEGE